MDFASTPAFQTGNENCDQNSTEPALAAQGFSAGKSGRFRRLGRRAFSGFRVQCDYPPNHQRPEISDPAHVAGNA